MPRETVASFSVESLQVLDEAGNVDEQLLPEVSETDLLELYRTMRRARRLDEKAIALQRRGELGTYAPSMGQEAAQVGSAFALREDDWLVPAFREGPAYLTRDVPIHKLLLYSMGMEEGAEVSPEDYTFPPSIAVGSQALHAAGLGWAHELKGIDRATVGYFGDGATSEGDVYEALNMAGVYDAHTVFICQNNQYAISVPRHQQTRAETIAQKAVAAGIDCLQVDGNDVLGMLAATREALSAAREGSPTLIEAQTYRRTMHTTADDPTVYRTREEEAEWEARDPIDRFEQFLRERGVLDDERAAAIGEAIEAELSDEVEKAKAAREALDPVDMFDYVYEERPPALDRQRAAFQARRGATDERSETGGDR